MQHLSIIFLTATVRKWQREKKRGKHTKWYRNRNLVVNSPYISE
jgi:hypothetical protein